MSDDEADTILVCPECDRAHVLASNGKPNRTAVETDYYCTDCGARFDTPVERERKWGGSGPKNGLAAILADESVTDPSDVFDVDEDVRTDGSGIPLAGDPPDEDATIGDLDDTLVADPESGTRYVVAVRSGELTLLAGGDPREGVAHETPASLYRKYQNGEYYGPDPDRSPWPILERLVGAGEVFGGP